MTDLVPRADVDSWAQILGPVGDLASKIASTEFAPKSLRGRAPAVAAAILAGRERGLGPMVSLASIDVVDGRPSLSAQLLAALVYRAGHRITVIESSDKAAEVKIERADGLGEATVRWTMADAQRAGLASKQNWQRYGRQMLYARALSECARMACPDVALGLDVDADPATMTPQPRPAPITIQVEQIDEQPTHNAPQTPVDAPQSDETVEVEELVTPAQLRKINAMLGDWERSEERRLDRDERRRMIAALADIDPDTLTSAKDLTRQQAFDAIEHLQALLATHAEQPTLGDDDG